MVPKKCKQIATSMKLEFTRLKKKGGGGAQNAQPQLTSLVLRDDFTHLADTGVENSTTTTKRTATEKKIKPALAVAILKLSTPLHELSTQFACHVTAARRPENINRTDFISAVGKRDFALGVV